MPKQTASAKERKAPSGASQTSRWWGDHFQGWRRHHRDVARDSFTRLLGDPLSSLMTWLVIAIALALPAALYVALDNLSRMSADWDGSAQISVFLHPAMSEARSGEFRQQLAEIPEVEQVIYMAPDQALDEFREFSGYGEVLDGLDENPLPGVMLVKLRSSEGPQQVREFAQSIEERAEVDQVVVDLEWVQKLFQLMALGQRLTLLLGGLLSLGVLLVIGNTVRLAIESRRDEIIIVKLVGGSDAFVRRPFLYTGVWYGLGGGILAWVVLSLSLWGLQAPVARLADLYISDFVLQGLGFTETLALWGFAVALGLTGALLAVSRHLSSIEPG